MSIGKDRKLGSHGLRDVNSHYLVRICYRASIYLASILFPLYSILKIGLQPPIFKNGLIKGGESVIVLSTFGPLENDGYEEITFSSL